MNQLHELTLLIDAFAALIAAIAQLINAIRRPP